ncbi:DoxX family protein [Streptomyces sp. NPDC001514]
MNVLTWVLQALMAALFLVHGGLMIAPPEWLVRRMRERGREPSWPHSVLVFTGIAEVLGAVGLILPAATGILPVLTPLAAVGLAIVMVGGTVYHLQRHEGSLATVVIGLICVAIAVLRWTLVPL